MEIDHGLRASLGKKFRVPQMGSWRGLCHVLSAMCVFLPWVFYLGLQAQGGNRGEIFVVWLLFRFQSLDFFEVMLVLGLWGSNTPCTQFLFSISFP